MMSASLEMMTSQAKCGSACEEERVGLRSGVHPRTIGINLRDDDR